MGKVQLTIPQATADEVSEKLEIALTPVPLTLEQRVEALEARRVWRGRTPPNGELVETIIATEAGPYQFYVLFSVPLPDIKAGDLIEANCQFEMTHTEPNLDARYMVGKFLMIGDGPSDMSTVKPKLNNATATNIEKLRTHETFHFFGDYIAPQDMTGKHVNVIIYSQRLGLQGNGSIRVDQNYGFLSVKVTPASMLE